MRTCRLGALALALWLTGCGDDLLRPAEVEPGDAGSAEPSPVGVQPDAGSAAAGGDCRGILSDLPSCGELSAWIGCLASAGPSCSTVLRLDYQTLALSSFQVVCGPEVPTSADSARATVESILAGAPIVSGDSPYAYVFASADGLALVSQRTGLLLFGGTTVAGGGEVLAPASSFAWSNFAVGSCASDPTLGVAFRGYATSEGPPLSGAQAGDALAAVSNTTPFLDGLAGSGELLDAVVVPYASSPDEPSEVVVVIDSRRHQP